MPIALGILGGIAAGAIGTLFVQKSPTLNLVVLAACAWVAVQAHKEFS